MNLHPSNSTRDSLLVRARGQDSQAWSELVDLYGPLIAHWCHRCGLDTQRTADAVQEVFLSLSKSLSSFQPQKENGAFRAWLWTITANKVKDLHRRLDAHPRATGGSTALASLAEIEEQNLVPEEEPSDDQQINELVSRAMKQVQHEFEGRTWDMFRRTIVDQIPTAIVAQEFCVTAAAVRQARSRVLRRLRQQLGDIDD